ncbi:CBS domain-containing protein [Abyssalbus ytuae]|uniref:CBS domain-containing protein n=1 Tax=Abyssalbus ytuae TaxID=2926907 RepID=A0A9E7D191_9FLAO|nr:CBS domain-containing protein [Abyssalbus ytuae]UOB16808.1 CBS domain-containing protein [Abyssalbus ytuae]
MKNKVKVSTIMTTDLIQLNISDSLYKAEKLFKKYKIRHLPVVQGKRIVGILSYTDLLRISYVDVIDEDDETVESIVYDMFSLPQVMMNKPVVVSPDTPIKEVAEILSQREFHALPVVENDELVGIVTTTDLIRYFYSEFYAEKPLSKLEQI